MNDAPNPNCPIDHSLPGMLLPMHCRWCHPEYGQEKPMIMQPRAPRPRVALLKKSTPRPRVELKKPKARGKK